MCQAERVESGSKEGESCLFLREYCMSSGNPFYHFAACNMRSIPMSHSTNILVSPCLQHHGPTMRYPHALPASSPPFSSFEPSPHLHLFIGLSMEPIPQVMRYICISCPAAVHLPAHNESGQRLRLCGSTSHPLPLQYQAAKGGALGKHILP